MKQKNLFFILFLTNLILHPSSIFCLKLKSMQSFSELKDIEADGINLQDMNKIKDIAGLDSMLSNVATDKIAPQSKPNPSDVESIRNQLLKETMGQSDNSLDNKSININENDIDKIIKDKEQQIEVNPNAVLANIDSLTKSKPAKEEETLTGMESCDDIKKYGKQRLYCEDKFLLKFGEEKTVNCMKNFCSICCKSDENCLDKCSSTHSFFKGHDPEEMFISVCANENMGPAFKNFCGSMIVEDNKQEFDQCYTNFCFDCCSNELKITDFNDVEIQKCLKICKEGKNLPKSSKTVNPVANLPNNVAKKKKVNLKPIELSDEIKKILEKPSDGNEKNQASDNMFKDLNNNSKIKNKKTESSKENNDQMKFDNSLNSLPKKSTVSPPNKNLPSKETKKIQVNLDNKLSRKEKNTKICEILILNLNIDSYGKEVANSCKNDYRKFHFQNDKDCRENLCNDCCGFLEIKREITFCQKQCLFQKIDLDELNQITQHEKNFLKQNLPVDKQTVENESNGMNPIATNNPKETKSFIENNLNEIKPNVENSSNDNIPVKQNELQEENDINNSIYKSLQKSPMEQHSGEIEELKKQMKTLQDKITEMSKNKKDYLEKKIDELNRNKEEAVKVDQQFVNELKTMKLSAKQLNNTEIFPHFLNASRFRDVNFMYFKLIDSLCLARYFKNCKETLCNDYCNDSPNLVNDKCFKDCTMFVNENQKEDLFQYIVKRHSYYEAKIDVIDEKINDDTSNKLVLNLTNTTNNTNTNATNIVEEERIENMIRSSKKVIENLKKKMINEEKNLLSLYKLKRK